MIHISYNINSWAVLINMIIIGSLFLIFRSSKNWKGIFNYQGIPADSAGSEIASGEWEHHHPWICKISTSELWTIVSWGSGGYSEFSSC